MSDVQASRLREAREYLGFTQEDAAAALGWDAETLRDMESGRYPADGPLLPFLARLYRRPLAWFRGESTFQPSEDILRSVEHLHPDDREAVLDFAEWLQSAGPAPELEAGQ